MTIILPENIRNKSKYIVFTSEFFIPLIIIVLVISGWWVVYHTSVFAIRDVQCILDYQPCANESVKAELGKLTGSNLVTLKTDPIVSRLTAGDFTVRSVTISKKYPHTLVADMQSVYPVSAIHIADSSDWVVIDERSRVIAIRHQDPNVPQVLVDSLPAVQIGQKIADDTLLKGLSAAQSIATEIPSVRSVSLSGDTLTLHLDAGKIAIMTLIGDREKQIHILQAILTDSTMIKGVKSIDVRFASPVLKP